MMNKALLTAVGVGAICGALAFAQPANANIKLTGGVSATTTSGAPYNNDIIFPAYGLNSVSGFDLPASGADVGGLFVDTLSNISVQFLGREAGFRNIFQYNGSTVFTNPGGGSPYYNPGAVVSVGQLAANAYLPFRFGNNGSTTVGVVNGNPSTANCTNCSMFITFLGDDPGDASTYLKPISGKSSRIVDVFFNDSYGDDNSDDMVVRITATPVPVPAALPIIGAALAGFGFAGWRRRAA